MSKLISRPDIFNLYWHFAFERNEIFYKKLNGESAPWTDDPILREFRFTNTYRVHDRVSQTLLREVIYNGKEYTPEDTILRILLYRVFNMESTWRALVDHFGDVTLEDFTAEKYGEFLTELKERQSIFGPAYIMYPAMQYGSKEKHVNYLRWLEKMLKEDNGSEKLLNCKNMREGYEFLKTYPAIANFLAYQYATDLNYSDIVNWQETDFTIPGGGALRGINKVFSDLGGMEPSAAIWYMYDHQEEEFAKRGMDFKKIGGVRKMQPIDCQNVFCEVDKYCRQAHPELKTVIKKIKRKYQPNGDKHDIIYPPKWKIDPEFTYYKN